MEPDTLRRRPATDLSIDVDGIATLIATTQLPSGEIPWCEGQKTDPWDHVEAAMGLTIGGYLTEARRAFEWMAQCSLRTAAGIRPICRAYLHDRTRDTNLSSYIAVGVLHYYLSPAILHFSKRCGTGVCRN